MFQVIARVGLLALVFISLAPHALIGIDDHHDGLILYSINDLVNRGLWPGSEFSQYGPLHNTLAAVPAMLGLKSYVWTKLLLAFSYASAGLAFVMLFNRLRAPLLGVAALLFYLYYYPFYDEVQIVWASGYAMVLSVWMQYLLAGWLTLWP